MVLGMGAVVLVPLLSWRGSGDGIQSPQGSWDSARRGRLGVADGTRTHDNRNHNPGLYQLSYSHRRESRTLEEMWRARRDSNPQPPA